MVICEGVMGLFDGAFVGKGETCGSSADLSRATGRPVGRWFWSSTPAPSSKATASYVTSEIYKGRSKCFPKLENNGNHSWNQNQS